MTTVVNQTVQTHSAVNAISAAMLSGGIGSMAIGLFTVGAEMSSGFKGMLNWYDPAGAISGKTAAGVIVWLIMWVLLNRRWQQSDAPALNTVFMATLVLVGVGLALTFPPIFTLFG